MADLDDLPNLTDGADPVNTGSAVDEAFWDDVQAALTGECRGTTDPTRTPAQTTDEMLAGRGGFGSLSLRLSDWEARQYVERHAIRNGIVLGNLLANDTFKMWSRGDALAPDYWALSGSGAAVARCGVGQADTTAIDTMDDFSAKLTYGSAAAVLSQEVVSVAMDGRMHGALVTRYRPLDSSGSRLSGYDEDDNVYYYLIGHVRSLTAGIARLAIYDGSQYAYSPYHTADVIPEPFSTLIAGPLPVNLRMQAQCRVEGAGSAYFQGLALIASPLELPPMYVPAKVNYKTLTYYVNNPATGVLTYFTFARPAFILGAQMQCLTAGTVTAPTCDLLTPIGGVYSSLFVTAPTIATGQLVGAAQACDPAAANYRRRTIRPALSASATQVDNTSLRLDYVDDGGGALRDLMVTIHYLEYDRPLDQFRSMSDLGE